MFSRSDFGLVPLILLITQLPSRNKQKIAANVAALAGAVIGLILVATHTYFISGEWAPASAQIKSHWAQVNGLTATPGYLTLISLISPSPTPYEVNTRTITCTSLLIAITLLTLHSILTRKLQRKEIISWLSASAIIFAYLILYARNGAVQLWYAASFLVPLSMFVGVPLAKTIEKHTTISVTAAAAFIAISWLLTIAPPWPWQASMMRGAIYVKELHKAEKIGAWNAGIMSYFSERNVVNLDGLVNDRILPYVRNGTIAEYVATQKIAYIADFPVMLSAMFAASHGYGDGKLSDCMANEKELEAPRDERFGGNLTIYKIKKDCLD